MFWVLGVTVLRFVDLSFSLALMSDFDLDIFLFRYGHWCLGTPILPILLFILIFMMQIVVIGNTLIGI